MLQIEERAREWLSTEEEKLSAAHAAQLVRIQILADWHGHLDGPSHAAERKWCVDRVEQLVSTASPENANTVLRLSPAIPIVAAAPGQGATQDNAHSEQDNSSDLEEHEE